MDKKKQIEMMIEGKKESIKRFENQIRYHYDEIRLSNNCIDTLQRGIFDLQIQLKQ